jgi:hypothetical protein
MVFAPAQQLFTAKTTISTDNYLGIRPTGTNTFHDRYQLFHRTCRSIIVGRTQSSTEQMLSAKNIQRQVTVGLVIPMKKAPLLVAVQRVVGSIDIKDNLFGGNSV